MGTYSEHEQRKLDQESGADLDRHAAKPALRYTAGPWLMQPTAGDHDFMIYDEATGRDVALVRDFNEPNARLIAAAPELAEACRKLAAWDQSDDDALLISEACSLARAALAKAGVL